jgi:TetR/AcrR family transcriptional regulator
MEDLAAAADVSVGSVYSLFGSKDGVFLALAERALEQFAGYLDDAFRPDYSPLEQVLAAGDAYLRFHLQHPGSFRFLAFGFMPNQIDDDLARRVGGRLREIVGRFQERIEVAIEAGEADTGFDGKLTARFLWGAWNGVVSFSLRGDEMALTDDEISACLQLGRRLVSEGLSAPGFRDKSGHSRARLMDTSRPGSTASEF